MTVQELIFQETQLFDLKIGLYRSRINSKIKKTPSLFERFFWFWYFQSGALRDVTKQNPLSVTKKVQALTWTFFIYKLIEINL